MEPTRTFPEVAMSPRVVSAAEWLTTCKKLLAALHVRPILGRRLPFNYDFHVAHDLTPLGRQDETAELRHHDRYAEVAR